MSNEETKAAVLAWIDEWEDKGIDPNTGCFVCDRRIWVPGRASVGSELIGLAAPSDNRDSENQIALLARILKLDKPKAAEIQWKKLNEWLWVGDSHLYEYPNGPLICRTFHETWEPYFGNQKLGVGWNDIEKSKPLLQAHKQKRLDELL